MPKLSEKQRVEIIALRRSGRRQQQTAAEVHCSQSQVSYTLKKYQAHGTTRDLPRSGRPKTYSTADARALRRSVNSGNADTVDEVRREARLGGLPDATAKTVRKALKSRGMGSFVEQDKSDLNDKRALARLHWAKARKTLPLTQWARVIFTDECYIKTQGRIRKRRIWRDKGTPMGQRRGRATSHFGRGAIMVWGAITSTGHAYIFLGRGNAEWPALHRAVEEGPSGHPPKPFPASLAGWWGPDLPARQRDLPQREGCAAICARRAGRPQHGVAPVLAGHQPHRELLENAEGGGLAWPGPAEPGRVARPGRPPCRRGPDRRLERPHRQTLREHVPPIGRCDQEPRLVYQVLEACFKEVISFFPNTVGHRVLRLATCP